MASNRRTRESARTWYPQANVLIALTSVVLIGIAWWATMHRIGHERADTIAGAVRQNENLALAFEEHTVRTLKGIDQALSFVRNQYLEHGLKLNIRGMIENGTLDASLFAFVGVADERGNLVLGSASFAPTSIADWKSFELHRRNNDREMLIEKAILGRITRKWVIPMSRRINEPDGSFGGIVFASVDPAYFTSYYQKADLGERGAISLMGLDGVSRAMRVGQRASTGDDMRGTQVFAEKDRRSAGSLVGAGKLDGDVRLLSYRTLAHYPLVVTVGTSRAEILAPLRQRENGYYLAAGLASALLVILAGFAMAACSRQERTLASLMESEARFRATFDQRAVGVAHTTLDGRMIQTNAKVSEILGYTSAELSTMSLGDVIVPEDFEGTKRDRERLLSGETQELVAEARYVRKDRSVGSVDYGLSVVRDHSGKPSYFIIQMLDVTPRKRAEEALRESERRYREVVNNVNDVIYIMDIDPREPLSGAVRFVSSRAAQIVGCRPEEFLADQGLWFSLLHPDDIEVLQKRTAAIYANGKPGLREYRVRHRATGEYRWMEDLVRPQLNADGRVTSVFGVARDVTERKWVEQAALEQFKLAETFFNDSVSCLVILDRNFNFLRVNAAYARACHRDIGEFAGRNHFEMYPSDTKAIFEEVVRTKRPFETYTRAFTFPDQPERGVTYWDWTLVPVLDAQAEVEYLVFSLNEVTERQRAEEALKQSLHQVQALSERIMKVQQDERDGIARELHDELGQSLTALKVNLQILEPYCTGGEAEDHLTEALMIVGRSLEQVRGMTLDLRPLALEELGLAAALESHLARQAEAAGWNSHLEAAALRGRLRPELEMTCFRIAQEALTNVMRHASAKHVWVALSLNAGEVELSVRDDGRGFNVAAAGDSVHAPSFGLTGMRERARQMGGRLSIRSAPGCGTEVRVSFPAEPTGTRGPDANARTHA